MPALLNSSMLPATNLFLVFYIFFERSVSETNAIKIFPLTLEQQQLSKEDGEHIAELNYWTTNLNKTLIWLLNYYCADFHHGCTKRKGGHKVKISASVHISLCMFLSV